MATLGSQAFHCCPADLVSWPIQGSTPAARLGLFFCSQQWQEMAQCIQILGPGPPRVHIQDSQPPGMSRTDFYQNKMNTENETLTPPGDCSTSVALWPQTPSPPWPVLEKRDGGLPRWAGQSKTRGQRAWVPSSAWPPVPWGPAVGIFRAWFVSVLMCGDRLHDPQSVSRSGNLQFCLKQPGCLRPAQQCQCSKETWGQEER